MDAAVSIMPSPALSSYQWCRRRVRVNSRRQPRQTLEAVSFIHSSSRRGGEAYSELLSTLTPPTSRAGKGSMALALHAIGSVIG